MARYNTPAAPLALPMLFSLLLVACSVPPPEPSPAPVPQVLPTETESIDSPPEEIIQPPALPDTGLLLGLEPRQMQDVLGTPNLVRREGAAQVMQFANGNCVLDVTFYEESEGGAFRAEHLSSRMTDGAPFTPQQCLAAILPGGQYPAGLFPEEAPVEVPEPAPASEPEPES